MKKVLLGLLAAIIVAVLGVLGLASTQPDILHVERSLTMAGTPGDVFPFANDFARFQEWQPWAGLDPNQVVELSDPSAGVGAWYTWKGNDDVGQGRMEVTASAPGKITHSLDFLAPWVSHADTTISTSTASDQPTATVDVTWSFDQDQDLMGKVMGVFMDMDSMLGDDFDRGLHNLQPLVEAAASARTQADAAAVDEAAAAAATAAAEAGSDLPR